MAETRLLKTKIWSDDWFNELSVEARYFYLFLLSNRNTHICGYYKISIKEMMFLTGLTELKIQKAVDELVENVRYIDGWVVIRNYPKHQNVSNNAKVQASIDREMENIPESIKSKSKSKSKSESMDSLSIPSKKDKKVDKSGDKGKKMYGEFKNVALTDEEKQKLIDTYGRAEAKALVDELSTGIESKGYKYKSHYATLRNWAKRKGLQVIPSKEPKMIPETLDNGTVRMVPNPKYHAT